MLPFFFALPLHFAKKKYPIDPPPPRLVSQDATKFRLCWDEVNFCGSVVTILKDSINYVLELAEGVEYKEGLASKFITDLAINNYRQVCRNAVAGQAEVSDLKAGTWYHARLAIEYNGTRVVSETLSFHTTR